MTEEGYGCGLEETIGYGSQSFCFRPPSFIRSLVTLFRAVMQLRETRVMNFKFPLQPHEKYYIITQCGEFGFS